MRNKHLAPTGARSACGKKPVEKCESVRRTCLNNWTIYQGLRPMAESVSCMKPFGCYLSFTTFSVECWSFRAVAAAAAVCWCARPICDAADVWTLTLVMLIAQRHIHWASPSINLKAIPGRTNQTLNCEKWQRLRHTIVKFYLCVDFCILWQWEVFMECGTTWHVISSTSSSSRCDVRLRCIHCDNRHNNCRRRAGGTCIPWPRAAETSTRFA